VTTTVHAPVHPVTSIPQVRLATSQYAAHVVLGVPPSSEGVPVELERSSPQPESAAPIMMTTLAAVRSLFIPGVISPLYYGAEGNEGHQFSEMREVRSNNQRVDDVNTPGGGAARVFTGNATVLPLWSWLEIQ
jgi:hypothetical protein